MPLARVLRIASDASDSAALAEAAHMVRDGGLVAFPTETVYGLGADAGNPKALERLNRVKGRPPDKPYSLLVHDVRQIEALAAELSPAALRLMERFWPGPLTLVLPGKHGGTIGFRLPDHPIALAFLRACDMPIAAPSANRSGATPPTDAETVLAGLGTEIDLLLDGGPTPLGRESSVAQVAGDLVTMLREGAVSADELLSVTR